MNVPDNTTFGNVRICMLKGEKGDGVEAMESAIETERSERIAADDAIRSAIGTPLKASTAAQMTNTSKIYVYTGSETGYTAGHWYYYTGSAWADGGVYNSTAFETDKTLAVADMAADAKETGDQITDLKSALTHYDTNGLDLKYPKQPYIINGSGKWSNPISRHYLIPFTSGSVITITANSTWFTYYALLKSANIVSGADADFCSEHTGRVKVNANTTTTIPAPSDCNYILVVASSDNGSIMSPVSVILDGEEQAYNIRKEITASKAQIYKELDGTNGLTDKYIPAPYIINGTTNKWDYSLAEHIMIPVKSTDVVTITANDTWQTYYALLKTNAVVAGAAVDFATGQTGRVPISAGATATIDNLPSDCHYINITLHGTQVQNDQTPKSVTINGVEMAYNIRKKIDALSDKISNMDWALLKWACVGDSLTEYNVRARIHYFDYISSITGIKIYNLGLSGSGYMRKHDTNQAFYQRIQNVPLDSDIVTIFGSPNDLAGDYYTKLGSASDTGTDTVGGCINTTLDNLYALMPNVKLGIISPIKTYKPGPGYEGITDQNMQIYVGILNTICQTRSIPFLNLYSSVNLYPTDETFRKIFYSNDGTDGLHPNELGNLLLAGKIKEFVRSLIES